MIYSLFKYINPGQLILLTGVYVYYGLDFFLLLLGVLTISTSLQAQKVGAPAEIETEASVCAGEIYIWRGGVYSENGNYEDREPNANGCEDIFRLRLEVVDLDATVIAEGSLLSAPMVGVDYQWVNCNENFAPIEGATAQSFEAAGSGSYAVI